MDEEWSEQLATSAETSSADARLARFQRTTEERFNAIALWGLGQTFRDARSSVSWWAADGERLLGIVHTGAEKWDARVTLMTRDAAGRYRRVRESKAFPTVRLAEDAISGPLGEDALALGLALEANGPPGVDLFAPLVPDEKIAPEFRYLRDGFNQSGARALLRALQPWIVDMDGNLVKDFQTTGYSSRIWEIYLQFAFSEMNLAIGREHQSPDFELIRGDEKVFVEATTVNPTGSARGAGLRRGAPPPRPEDFMRHTEEVMPLRFGSPLHSKMQKRYWDLDHVKGNPLVFAIADFHDAFSMTWSHTALAVYLYGRSAEVSIDEDGQRLGVEKVLDGFDRKDERLKPFFEQAGAENISAVLSSNAGTIAKFNRIGVRAGFGDRYVSLYRQGGRFVPGDDALDALPFVEDVEAAAFPRGLVRRARYVPQP